MFGYVTPLKGEMKVKDFERFKCYYCGLCCQIKKNFGSLPRLSLNYDMTFLGLLLDGLSSDDIEISKYRCMLHPAQKKIIIYNNKALSYAAYMNISLVYYKFVDDVKDDNNISSRLKSYMLWSYKKKFPKEVESINNKIAECLCELNKLESHKNFSSIDEISHPFSNLVGIILRDYPGKLLNDNTDLRNILYNFGYTLGKWIYLIDALDDLKEDMAKNKFNPINHLYNIENLDYNKFIETIKPRIEFTILNCGYTCLDNLQKLNLVRNKDILYNVIELGLMDKYLKVISNPDKTNESKRSDL